MTTWTWGSRAPDAEGCGVSGDEGDAKAAAVAWMREHKATTARAEAGAAGRHGVGLRACRTGYRGGHERHQSDPLAPGGPVSTFVRKSDQVAAPIRGRIAHGSLRAGMYAPSGAELAKETGFAVRTCRRGLQVLFRDGVLVQMARSTRYRVVGAPPADGLGLSHALAERRCAAGLTRRTWPTRSGCPSGCRPRRDKPSIALPPVLAASRPGAQSRRCLSRRVRRVARGRAAQLDGGRARHDDHARSVQRGRSRHHACLRPGSGYGQMGRWISRHGAARADAGDHPGGAQWARYRRSAS